MGNGIMDQIRPHKMYRITQELHMQRKYVWQSHIYLCLLWSVPLRLVTGCGFSKKKRAQHHEREPALSLKGKCSKI